MPTLIAVVGFYLFVAGLTAIAIDNWRHPAERGLPPGPGWPGLFWPITLLVVAVRGFREFIPFAFALPRAHRSRRENG